MAPVGCVCAPILQLDTLFRFNYQPEFLRTRSYCQDRSLYKPTSRIQVIINDALLYSFRNHKHIFIWIAIISSLVFGAVHVITGSIFTSPMAFGLAVLKTLSAGICGVCWLLMYWKTRNLWGIALLHALCDFPTFLQSALTEVNVSLGGAENYTGAGVAGLAVYLVQIVCSVIAFIILWKKVGKTIDFEDIRRNW